jgi:hypothetical protein
MRLTGWCGDFYGLRIFAVSNWLCNLSTGKCRNGIVENAGVAELSNTYYSIVFGSPQN